MSTTAAVGIYSLEKLIQIAQKTIQDDDCCAAAVDKGLLMMQLASKLLCASFNNSTSTCTSVTCS